MNVNVNDLIDQDLAGWKLETWYELRLSVDEYGKTRSGGYFTDKKLALAAGVGKGCWGDDGKVSEVIVLTKNGQDAFRINGSPVTLSDEVVIRAELVAKALEKLSDAEMALLNDTE